MDGITGPNDHDASRRMNAELSVQAILSERDVIDAIHRQHELALLFENRKLEASRLAGELLNRMKAQVGHGAWEAWMAENLKFKARTAQNYMRLATHWDEIKSKTQDVADLTLTAALDLLTRHHQYDPHGGRPDNLTLPGIPEAPCAQVLPFTPNAIGAPEAVEEHECPFCGSMTTKNDTEDFWCDVQSALQTLNSSAINKYRNIDEAHEAVRWLLWAFRPAINKAVRRWNSEHKRKFDERRNRENRDGDPAAEAA